MIENSIALMTAIDLLIVVITVVVVWRNFHSGTGGPPAAPKIGLRLVMIGIVIIGLYYFADLVAMQVLPAFMSIPKSVEVMENLHRNFSWMVGLFSVLAISIGFSELKRTQEELAAKNRILENLSTNLSRYLSPQVYDAIFRGDQMVEIASKRKKLTIFFSDIAGFTEMTDRLEPEELSSLINHYLTEMSKIALEFGATIDKYVGDSILAFFGDPESKGVKEDAIACVEMAIAMQRRMRELQDQWMDLGLEKPFELRIGINTGYCAVGNFGSDDRMDYTIIGNEVNLASRLETTAEEGGIDIAHETFSLVKDYIQAEEQEAISLKGFDEPVRVYRVAGIYEDLESDGKVIRRDRDGIKFTIDMTRTEKVDAIRAVEDVLAELKR